MYTSYNGMIVCEANFNTSNIDNNYSVVKLGEDGHYKLLVNKNYVNEFNTFNYFELDFNFDNIIIGNKYIFDYRDENNVRIISSIYDELYDRDIEYTFRADKNLFLFEEIDTQEIFSNYILKELKVTKCTMK